MLTDEETMSAEALRATTELGSEEISTAAARAQQAGKRTMSNTIKVKTQGQNQIDYSIRGPGGVVEQLAFSLYWDAGQDVGPAKVSTKVHSYTTLRSKIFGIPYGKKRVPALKSYLAYVEWMDKEVRP